MPVSDDNLNAEDERRLVELLDEFEAGLRVGGQPRIESYLARVESRLQQALLSDLVQMEQELLPAAARPARQQYRARFPQFQELFAEAAPAAERRLPGGDTTLSLHDTPGAPARVEVVAGTQPGLMTQTAELLRTRLRVASWIAVVALGIFLLRAILHPDSQLVWLRACLLAIAAACSWRLSIARTTLGPWRLLELVLVLVVGVQTVSLQVADMLGAARAPDALGLNLAMLFAFATWSVAIMVYAILIPNSWRRAAAVLIPAAAAPLVVCLVLVAANPPVATLLRRDFMVAGALLTAVAAGAAIAGTYTVNHLRQQLYLARRFGQYRLLHRLGSGGMGEVYLAEHQLLKRPSAIKLIRPGYDTRADVITRFEREVQATAGLAHWNTVEIFDYGRTEDGTFYYVMEYLEGRTLQELVDTFGALPPGRVVYLLRPVCEALAEAHHAGLIHQDIKPANIFAARCGSQYDVAKLLDFGLVHEIARPECPTPGESPLAARIVGTPRFMSPEQALGIAVADVRSDIYSLGATAYYLLTGRPVFERASVSELLGAHLHSQVTPPTQLRSEVPADLEAIVLRCLAKRPEDRFGSAGELATALAACRCASEWTAERAADWWRANKR
ncbi:MAG: serine/threonine protein kinase [Pirellulaceae bacterium]|nr:serine/threonine protein kinase [Pirellulaceae bacterium]